MENIKTLGELLQEAVEKDDYFYSLHEFLLESTDEDRKRIEKMLTDMDYKQFYDYLDGFTFANRDEVHSACSDYFEKTMKRGTDIGESLDLYDVADDYINERNLVFNDELDELYEFYENEGIFTKEEIFNYIKEQEPKDLTEIENAVREFLDKKGCETENYDYELIAKDFNEN